MTAIEYIGPVPKKKKRKPVLGGWVILLMAGMFVSYFAWPTFAGYVKQQQDVATDDKAVQAIDILSHQDDFGSKLAVEALRRTQVDISYDGAYYQIDFPMGDVPSGKGVAADVVIRAYRALGVDLQQLVHDDMAVDFRLYPQLWGLKEPDTNIDHRRVPNLQRFFSRHGQEIPVSREMPGFNYGDVVVWRLPHGESEDGVVDTHIGIVVPGPGSRAAEKWIVHNIGEGTKWENSLLDYDLIGHYRYQR